MIWFENDKQPATQGTHLVCILDAGNPPKSSYAIGVRINERWYVPGVKNEDITHWTYLEPPLETNLAIQWNK